MDPMIVAAANEAAGALAGKLTLRALDLGWRKVKWLPVVLQRRQEQVRVVCSAFLRMQDEDGRFLLIRNLHRPEFYGPLGGCYKHTSGARPLLDAMLFCGDDAVAPEESRRDLRGYVRRADTARFFEWFASNDGSRESARECLARELGEEVFDECGLDRPEGFVASELEFRPVRAFLERSSIDDGRVLQFRLFEVYDLVMQSEASRLLQRCVVDASHPNLRWVRASDLRTGRTRDHATIGHAAMLLVSDRLTRPDAPIHR